MPIAAWIALARDVFVVVVLGWILFYIHRAEQNAVKVQDMEAVMKRLDDNVAQETKWEQQRENAEAQQTVEMQAINTAISQQRAPIIVREPPRSGPVSSTPPTTSSDPACPGGATAGSGADIRPAINAFEVKYEAYLSECRSILKEWPQ